jgi:hypothetical protein
MVLFDIGAVLYIAGLIWIIMFLIKKNKGAVILSVIISLLGGLIMFVSYYLLMNNQSVFDKMIS